VQCFQVYYYYLSGCYHVATVYFIVRFYSQMHCLLYILLSFCRTMLCINAAYVTNNKTLYSTFCTVEANYWQTWSIARPLSDSRATCFTIGYPHHSGIFRTKRHGNISSGSPLTGASNAGGVGKNCDSRPTSIASSRVVKGATVKSAPDRGKLVTLVAGSNKRRRLLFTGDDDEVFMTRSFNVTRQNSI